MRFLSVLLLAAAACMHQGAWARETVTLCFERQEVLPWRTPDGRGLNFELLDEVARRVEVRFEYQAMPWKRCLAQLEANLVDGAFAASFSPARLPLGAWPGGEQADPARGMHVDRYVLVRRKGSLVDWDGKAFHHLDGRIGVQLGYSIGDFLRELGVEIDEGSQQADELARKLVAGRLAAAALGGADALRLMRGPLGRRLEVAPMPLVEKDYYLVLSHALAARRPQLAQRIWDAIGQVRASAAYRKRERLLAPE